MNYTVRLVSLAHSGFFKKFPIPSNTPFEGEILLGRKILDKALLDYFSSDPSCIGEDRGKVFTSSAISEFSDKTMKQEVSIWLGSDDFSSICQVALLPEETVLFVFNNIKKVVIDDCK